MTKTRTSTHTKNVYVKTMILIMSAGLLSAGFVSTPTAAQATNTTTITATNTQTVKAKTTKACQSAKKTMKQAKTPAAKAKAKKLVTKKCRTAPVAIVSIEGCKEAKKELKEWQSGKPWSAAYKKSVAEGIKEAKKLVTAYCRSSAVEMNPDGTPRQKYDYFNPDVNHPNFELSQLPSPERSAAIDGVSGVNHRDQSAEDYQFRVGFPEGVPAELIAAVKTKPYVMTTYSQIANLKLGESYVQNYSYTTYSGVYVSCQSCNTITITGAPTYTVNGGAVLVQYRYTESYEEIKRPWFPTTEKGEIVQYKSIGPNAETTFYLPTIWASWPHTVSISPRGDIEIKRTTGNREVSTYPAS